MHVVVSQASGKTDGPVPYRPSGRGRLVLLSVTGEVQTRTVLDGAPVEVSVDLAPILFEEFGPVKAACDAFAAVDIVSK